MRYILFLSSFYTCENVHREVRQLAQVAQLQYVWARILGKKGPRDCEDTVEIWDCGNGRIFLFCFEWLKKQNAIIEQIFSFSNR